MRVTRTSERTSSQARANTWVAVSCTLIPQRGNGDDAAPADTDPTYTLECVQWPQSTCEESAHRLAERYAKTYPNLRVVSITVAGPCGSFQMRFDDGSGVGGDIDCIPPVPSD